MSEPIVWLLNLISAFTQTDCISFHVKPSVKLGSQIIDKFLSAIFTRTIECPWVFIIGIDLVCDISWWTSSVILDDGT